MRPDAPNSPDLVLLKLCDFESTMNTWLNEVILFKFFGSAINLETGYLIASFLSDKMPEVIEQFPMIQRSIVSPPSNLGGDISIKVTFYLSDGVQMERKITIGKFISYGENI